MQFSVFLPLLIASVFISWLFCSNFTSSPPEGGSAWSRPALLALYLGIASGLVLGLVRCVVVFFIRGKPKDRREIKDALRTAFYSALSGLVGGFLFSVSFMEGLWTIDQSTQPAAALALGPPLLLGVFLLGIVMEIGLHGRMLKEDEREWWGTIGGYLLIYLLGWLAFFTITLFSEPLLGASRRKLSWRRRDEGDDMKPESRASLAPNGRRIRDWRTGRGGAPTGNDESRERQADLITGFDPDDDFPLSDLHIGKNHTNQKTYWGPFLIVNTALNLETGDELAWQERKADSFVLTSLAGGSKTTGYRPLPSYNPAQPDQTCDLTIGRAIAISGAAASPNMGYHSSPPLAFLMTIFNVRLGWWMQNPREPDWRAGSPARWDLILHELLGQANEKGRYVYLSDGGHFENLGAYELIRRRCRFIVICDADADPSYEFFDLGNLIRKCRNDFGIRIEIDVAALRPQGTDRRSHWHCAIGAIRYDDLNSNFLPGILVYLKSSLTGNEPSDILAYADQCPTFPHQSTTNQFFAESQFESYRALGFHIIQEVFGEVTDPHDIKCKRVPSGDGRAATASRDEAKHEDETTKNRRIFSRLRRRWFPPPPNLEPNFLESVKGFLAVHQALRREKSLADLTGDLYPEMENLLRDEVEDGEDCEEHTGEGQEAPPPETAEAAAAATPAEPTPALESERTPRLEVGSPTGNDLEPSNTPENENPPLTPPNREVAGATDPVNTPTPVEQAQIVEEGHDPATAAENPGGDNPGSENGRMAKEEADARNRHCAELHAVSLMLQVMENAWLGLKLGQYYEHPLNRGWMTVFRRWSNSDAFSKHWPALRGQYSQEFVWFCEKELRLLIWDVGAERLSKNMTSLLDDIRKDRIVDDKPCPSNDSEKRDLANLSKEFAFDWFREKEGGRGLPELMQRALTLSAELQKEPYIWIIRVTNASKEEEKGLGKGNVVYACGVILLFRPLFAPEPTAPEKTTDQDNKFEFFVWIDGPYRNQSIGRDPDYVQQALNTIRAELKEKLNKEFFLFARYPEEGKAEGNEPLERSLWSNFFHYYDFHRAKSEEFGRKQDLIFVSRSN